MSSTHPFLKRIRTERFIIGLINGRHDYFRSELTGLSREAITAWFDGISETIRSNKDVGKLRDKLEYVGQISKLASNGSHRGAMIAPAPNEEVIKQLIDEIYVELASMPSKNVN